MARQAAHRQRWPRSTWHGGDMRVRAGTYTCCHLCNVPYRHALNSKMWWAIRHHWAGQLTVWSCKPNLMSSITGFGVRAERAPWKCGIVSSRVDAKALLLMVHSQRLYVGARQHVYQPAARGEGGASAAGVSPASGSYLGTQRPQVHARTIGKKAYRYSGRYARKVMHANEVPMGCAVFVTLVRCLAATCHAVRRGDLPCLPLPGTCCARKPPHPHVPPLPAACVHTLCRMRMTSPSAARGQPEDTRSSCPSLLSTPLPGPCPSLHMCAYRCPIPSSRAARLD